MTRNLTTGLQRGLRQSIAGGLGAGDIFSTASLDLNFARHKSLDSRITFSRASSGTYVDAAGVIRTAGNNVARFDHDPTTGESLGLLVEESRTNLLLYSEEFDQATTDWFQTASTIDSDAIEAPDGNNTADKLIATSGATEHHVRKEFSATAGTTYTFSCFLKAAERSSFGLAFRVAGVWPSGQNQVIQFTLTGNGSYSVTSGSPTGDIIALGNGWYRCHLTATAAVTGTAQARVQDVYDADDEGIYLWGAQLEEGSFPTSYIPSEGSQGERAADVATDTTRGAALRLLFAQFRSPASGTRPIVSLDDNTANERIELFTSGTDPKLLITDGGSAQADLDAGAITANTTARLAARFNTDNFAASISGGAEVTDTNGTMPTVDRIRIGRDQAGNYLNGTIARITGWDSPLPLLSTITT